MNWRLRHAKRERSYLWTEGDSYMDGALGVELKTLVLTAASRGGADTSVGGATIEDIATRTEANTDLARQCRLVLWNGSADGDSNVASHLAEFDRIITVMGTSCVLLPPVSVGPSSSSAITAYTQAMIDIYTGLVVRGVVTFDPIDVLGPLGDGSANDLQDYAARVVPRSLLLDSVHLNLTAMTAIANRIASTLTAENL